MKQPGKIAALESLRGLLALWVVVAHVTARVISDASVVETHARAALEPLLPVYVFMILSGFVIWGLLRREHENWRTFITRRFFRLAPLYFAVLAVAALATPFELRALENLFWRNQHVYDAIKVHQETLAHFWPHLWAHVLMIQGLIPDTVLADSNFTFLSQGWSISLEWQFYLIAPALFALWTRERHLQLALCGIGIAAVGLLNIPSVGFLPNQFVWFVLGIASYQAWQSPGWYTHIPARAHDALLLALMALLYVLLHQPLPVLVWLVVMDSLLAQRTGRQTATTQAVNRLLEQPVLQKLGEMSYSVYLVHIPVLYVVFRALTKWDEHLFGWKFLALALPATLIVTLLVSTLTYRLIERPGIALGSRLAARKNVSPARDTLTVASRG